MGKATGGCKLPSESSPIIMYFSRLFRRYLLRSNKNPYSLKLSHRQILLFVNQRDHINGYYLLYPLFFKACNPITAFLDGIIGQTHQVIAIPLSILQR
jgi:hypothetical protein